MPLGDWTATTRLKGNQNTMFEKGMSASRMDGAFSCCRVMSPPEGAWLQHQKNAQASSGASLMRRRKFFYLSLQAVLFQEPW